MTLPGTTVSNDRFPTEPRLRGAPAAAAGLRATTAASLVACMLLLGACAGGSPPVRLYQLRSEPPAAASVAPPTASSVVWQLGRVQVPAYLDRDTLLLPTGQSGLQPLNGHRWAEPLRDAVPRLLKQDLARLLGADKVWGQPLPAGVQITQQLQLELQQLDATPAGDAVVLRARWTLVDAAGKAPARVWEAELRATTAGSDPDSLVSAHRAVLWQLAQRIAAGAAAAPPSAAVS